VKSPLKGNFIFGSFDLFLHFLSLRHFKLSELLDLLVLFLQWFLEASLLPCNNLLQKVVLPLLCLYRCEFHFVCLRPCFNKLILYCLKFIPILRALLTLLVHLLQFFVHRNMLISRYVNILVTLPL